jgi:hypothetical protein
LKSDSPADVVSLLNWKQRVGLALERLTYETLKSLLEHRIGTVGEERPFFNGVLWQAEGYVLFWNSQVVKQGLYPKLGLRGVRRRLADLVLCNNDLPEIVPYNSIWQSEAPPLQDIFAKAILAIECKNNNLDTRWGYPSHVEKFDEDIMSRFIWADKKGQNSIAKVLGFDVNWERYAGWQNLFPKAVKLLVMPNFVWLPSVKCTVRPTDADIDWMQVAADLLGADKHPLTIAKVAEKLQFDLMPPSFSVRDQIEWRIRRLKLQVLQLGYHPQPNRPVPYPVKRRLAFLLQPYIEKLIPKQRRKPPIGTKVAKPVAVEITKAKSKQAKKFRLTVEEKELKFLRKQGYEPPKPR